MISEIPLIDRDSWKAELMGIKHVAALNRHTEIHAAKCLTYKGEIVRENRAESQIDEDEHKNAT